GMPKSSAAAKQIAPHPRTTKRVREDEQLYLVRKAPNGTKNGFRHHRPREQRDEGPTETFDPASSKIDFSDNKRGAITKLLSSNAYYRTHPWPAPFDKTMHHLRLGDARDLSWIAGESVHLIVTSPPYWTLKKYEATDRQLG